MFSTKTRTRTPATFKPCLEALEDRCLLDANPISSVQTTAEAWFSSLENDIQTNPNPSQAATQLMVEQELGVQGALDVLAQSQVVANPITTTQMATVIQDSLKDVNAQLTVAKAKEAANFIKFCVAGFGLLSIEETPVGFFEAVDNAQDFLEAGKELYEGGKEIIALQSKQSALQNEMSDVLGAADFAQGSWAFQTSIAADEESMLLGLARSSHPPSLSSPPPSSSSLSPSPGPAPGPSSGLSAIAGTHSGTLTPSSATDQNGSTPRQVTLTINSDGSGSLSISPFEGQAFSTGFTATVTQESNGSLSLGATYTSAGSFALDMVVNGSLTNGNQLTGQSLELVDNSVVTAGNSVFFNNFTLTKS